ncbi:BolA family protein [Bartonella tamiae]|uniref:BolA protein n=1 Tax=Bartonella tamiae Th239 TaxID=1094558 RepID=J0ZS21_9HYPH|nr:BolA family protein [Bartonella tamiae]EJF91518.1 hypothetical protein ME5_00213 [Bartonella tamiae Th239]EJF92498.1 hypothetical protein MEG_01668 [Bartonella tamiae Th307]
MSSTVKQAIEKKLQDHFLPTALEVLNESSLHAGHHHDDGSSFDGTGETHFRIKIISKQFSGMNRLAMHRSIHDVLKEELANHVHALAIEAKAQ